METELLQELRQLRADQARQHTQLVKILSEGNRNTAKTARILNDKANWDAFFIDAVLVIAVVGTVYINDFAVHFIGKANEAICGYWPSIPGMQKPPKCQAIEKSKDTQPSSQLDALVSAITEQESGGNHQLVNSASGDDALGLFQIMDYNLPAWSKEVVGREVSPQEFIGNRDLQMQIGKFHLEKYLNTARQKTKDESEQIRLVACWWYGGTAANCNSTIRETGGTHPSISEYANKVLERYRSIPKGNATPTATGNLTNPAPGAVVTYWQTLRETDPVNSKSLPGYCHNGIDLGGPEGTPIIAADSGTVAYASWANNGYGNLVILKHGDNTFTLYGHNSALKVSEGQQVSKGQVIALMGSTGHSSGPHLHFTRFDASGDSLPVNSLAKDWGVKIYAQPQTPPQDCSKRTSAIALVK